MFGSVPFGATSPLLSSSTAERDPIRSASAPTVAGSAAEGTARQTRSQPASSISEVRLTEIPSGSGTPGRNSLFIRSRSIFSAFSPDRVPSWTSRPPLASSTATAVPQLPAPITAACRSGGSPPRYSHWSSMLGQMRSVTVAASCGRGVLGLREGHRLAGAQPHLARPDPEAAPDLLGALDRDRQYRGARLEREAPDAALRHPQ